MELKEDLDKSPFKHNCLVFYKIINWIKLSIFNNGARKPGYWHVEEQI